jgi:hypothetical protein
MGHEVQDQASLEMARRVAAGLDDHPEWIDHARENLRRWRRRNADVPSLLACYAPWETILDRPVAEIVATLLRDDEDGRRLRQNSPFAGVLWPREVWEIKRRVREGAGR